MLPGLAVNLIFGLNSVLWAGVILGAIQGVQMIRGRGVPERSNEAGGTPIL